MTPPRRDRAGARVASVVRAMRVLEAVGGRPEGVALSRLAATLGHGKATLSKILATLARDGFVHHDPLTGRFHLGWRLLALAFGHAERVGLPALCQPVLQALADETDELVQLAIVDGDQLLFVARAEGPGQQMRMLPLVGVAPPVHATAAGKAWIAQLPEAEARAIVKRQGLRPLTSRTLTSWASLAAQLREARAQGYAIVDEELVEGGRAAAAPILVRGCCVGAVAVSGPTFRLSVARLRRLAPRLVRAAAELAAVWPARATPRDFGLGIRPGADGQGAGANGARRTGHDRAGRGMR
jgi:IclR family acetate operon transcriptional repressor